MTAQARAAARWGLDDAARAVANDQPPPGSEAGSCNTLFADSYCPPPPRLEPRIGVDTVSWCWTDPEAVDRLLRLDGLVPPDGDHRPLRVVPGPGGSMRIARRIRGLGQLGAFPGASMLFVEGRARALDKADENDHGLSPLAALPGLETKVRAQLSALLGLSLDKRALHPPALRRIDLSGELLFDRGEDGRDFLSLVDQLHSPRHKTSPVRERGGPGIETAYWRTPRRSIPVLRVYDKGVESGTAAPGERIRIERQLRYDKPTRSTLARWLQRDLAALYAAPLKRWLQDGLTPGTPSQLIRLLVDAGVIWPNYWASGCCWCSTTGRVRRSLWPARKVERVLGTLTVIAEYGAACPVWSDKQRQRRMAEVRELGLLVTDRPVAVDVDAAINQLCNLWREAA